MRLPALRALAETQTLQCDTATAPHSGISSFLKGLCTEAGRGLVLPGPAAAMLAWAGTDEIAHLIDSCPVALLDGPMDLPLADQAPRGAVDLVTVNWREVAKQIATDIGNGEAFHEAKSTGFQAEHRLRVPLRDGATRPRQPHLVATLASLGTFTPLPEMLATAFA